ncbi:hypothetical protein [Rhodobacteraceae bacterium DSL-40]|uniref:hypothetical protein n=1 Tax=Amaricoccus sp. B4 TaxID=3368557 RepID=UPI000DAE97E4
MIIVVEDVEAIEELAYLKSLTGISCALGFRFSRRLFLNSFEAPSTHRHEARLLNPTREISAGRLPQGIAR